MNQKIFFYNVEFMEIFTQCVPKNDQIVQFVCHFWQPSLNSLLCVPSTVMQCTHNLQLTKLTFWVYWNPWPPSGISVYLHHIKVDTLVLKLLNYQKNVVQHVFRIYFFLYFTVRSSYAWSEGILCSATTWYERHILFV